MSSSATTLHFQTPTSAVAAAILEQAAGFLASLPDGVYERPCGAMMDACIGQHLRHSLDHVCAILDGHEDGIIDYDHRERGCAIETDRDAAASAINAALTGLAKIDPQAAGRTVSVRVMLTSSGETTDIPTTVGRELAFAAHHEIHHHAMMASIARHHGAEVPEGFGVAPSTINFEQRGA